VQIYNGNLRHLPVNFHVHLFFFLGWVRVIAIANYYKYSKCIEDISLACEILGLLYPRKKCGDSAERCYVELLIIILVNYSDLRGWVLASRTPDILKYNHLEIQSRMQLLRQ